MPDGQIGDPLSLLDLPNMGHRGTNKGVFAVVPGSFNPLHIAHRKIFDGVTKLYSAHKRVVTVFELSINRKDKEHLTFGDLLNRLEQFEWYAPVWVTNALFFFEKTGLVSQWIRPCFQVGYDTADRLLNDHGVLGVSGMEASFVVYPRMIGGSVCDMETLTNKYGFLPHNMEAGPKLSEEEMSASSTAIRNGAK
jgi:hypothetical protein